MPQTNKHFKQIFNILVVGFLGQFLITVVESKEVVAEELIHCDGEDLVVSKEIGEIQVNCSMELHVTEENMTCIALCMMEHLRGVDENGRPTKELYEKVLVAKAAPELHEKLKKIDCFEDAASKIQNEGALRCDSSKDFDTCFNNKIGELLESFRIRNTNNNPTDPLTLELLQSHRRKRTSSKERVKMDFSNTATDPAEACSSGGNQSGIARTDFLGLWNKNKTPEEKEINEDDEEVQEVSIIIESQIPGMIKGGYTIPMIVKSHLLWSEVFQMQKINIQKMDIDKHYLWGHNEVIDINSTVLDFYSKFSRTCANYRLSIKLRHPTPKPAAKVKRSKKGKGRRAKAKPKEKATKRAKLPARLVTLKPKMREWSPDIISGLYAPEPRRAPVPDERPKRKRRKKGQEPEAKRETAPRKRSPRKRAPKKPVAPRASEALQLSAAPCSFKLPALPRNNRMPTLPQSVPQPGSSFNPHQIVIRDESTQDGEAQALGEESIKPGVLKYIDEHISNRDMLDIRQELVELKTRQRFQSLNRLIRFTSGFLQNAFVDEHNN